MPDEKKVNIKTIADMANVSVSAVSRYLNSGYVSEEKREAISNAIEQTGYLPSKQAQSLRAKKSNVMGVVVPSMSSEAVARVVDGVSGVLKDEKYQMLFADTNSNDAEEVHYMGLFKSFPVDGIILSGTKLSKMHKIAFNKLQLPVVIVGQKFDHYPCVYHDDFGAAKALTELLISAGCKHIGMLAIPDDDRAVGFERLRGFRTALKEAGRPFSMTNQVVRVEFSIESGYMNVEELINRYPDLDGIVCATDSVAIGAMQRLKELGISIPNQMQIVGFGHGKMGRVVTPKLTSAHLFYRQAGEVAAKMLCKLIDKKEVEESQVMLTFEIATGGTTKRVPVKGENG